MISRYTGNVRTERKGERTRFTRLCVRVVKLLLLSLRDDSTLYGNFEIEIRLKNADNNRFSMYNSSRINPIVINSRKLCT